MRRQGPGPARVNPRHAPRLWVVAWALLAGLLIMVGVPLAAGRLTGSDTVGAQGSTVPVAPPLPPPPDPGVSVDLSARDIILRIVLRTEDGALIPLTSGRIEVGTDADGAQQATLPFGLTSGQTLAPFDDPGSGFKWTPRAVGGTLEFPVGEGDVPAVLSIELGPSPG